MGLFTWVSGLFSDESSLSGIDPTWNDNALNPANGLPMVGGTSGFDVEGNAYGTDFSHDDSFSSIDDSFNTGSSFDDSLSSSSSFDDW